jgi:hypothetical protein
MGADFPSNKNLPRILMRIDPMVRLIEVMVLASLCFFSAGSFVR